MPPPDSLLFSDHVSSDSHGGGGGHRGHRKAQQSVYEDSRFLTFEDQWHEQDYPDADPFTLPPLEVGVYQY